jgi:hypothetical protein
MVFMFFIFFFCVWFCFEGGNGALKPELTLKKTLHPTAYARHRPSALTIHLVPASLLNMSQPRLAAEAARGGAPGLVDSVARAIVALTGAAAPSGSEDSPPWYALFTGDNDPWSPGVDHGARGVADAGVEVEWDLIDGLIIFCYSIVHSRSKTHKKKLKRNPQAVVAPLVDQSVALMDSGDYAGLTAMYDRHIAPLAVHIGETAPDGWREEPRDEQPQRAEQPAYSESWANGTAPVAPAAPEPEFDYSLRPEAYHSLTLGRSYRWVWRL